jgi:MFS family permease
VNLWLAVAAGLLAILGSFRLLSPWAILSCVFFIGVGFAFHAPAWSAIVSDVVTTEELPSAAMLGGLQLNISGIIGPALGGVLLYLFGANWVFALNALCFVAVILVLLQWKGVAAESKVALENFFESFSDAIGYIRSVPAIRVVLARNILFSFFIAVIPALMPVVGLKELHLRPCSLGLTVYFHWGRFSFQRCSRSAAGPREALFECFDDPGESPSSRGLSSNGICKPAANLHGCCSSGWGWMDSVCVGTVAGQSASDP